MSAARRVRIVEALDVRSRRWHRDGMAPTAQRLVARLHVDNCHVSSAVCLHG
jgi:hypothetical protein